MRSVDLPELADLGELGPRQLEQTLFDLDVVRRRVEALIAETVAVAERTVAYADDGHASVSGWARATCNWSAGDTKAIVQCGRMLNALPEARAAAHAGTMGVTQTRLLASVFANPRCTEQLPGSANLLVDHAETLSYDDFAVVVRRWEALADADGAHDRHQRAHNSRDAHLAIAGERVYLDAHGGVLAGTVIDEIFERFCDAEFQADWDAGLASWGQRMTPAMLDRTPAQRRFDALLAVFTTAAASGKVGTFEPLVNIVVDQVTYQHHVALLTGGTTTPIDPATVDQRRCETSAGHQLAPAEVIAASLIGHVRRVIFDAAGVVIDLGRRSRLFTGGARDAVLLGNRQCIWPGCTQHSGRCQTDHSTPWASGIGPTSPANGAPLCSRHNLFKQRGYRTWRDPTGGWHTYRSDGTEIGRIDTAASLEPRVRAA